MLLAADPEAPQQAVDNIGQLELIEKLVELGQSGQ
jgi:hypothetical protein